jgi:hypothetical protein
MCRAYLLSVKKSLIRETMLPRRKEKRNWKRKRKKKTLSMGTQKPKRGRSLHLLQNPQRIASKTEADVE